MDLARYARPFSFYHDSEVGIVVIHGFTGTPATVASLGEYLDRCGYNVEGPCLTGHGTRLEDMNRVSYLDWVRDAEIALETLKKRCKTTFLAGLSMGGALAMYLAQRRSDVAGLVLINHAVLLNPDWRLAFVPLLKWLIPSVPGNPSDIKDPDAPNVHYKDNSLKGLHELIRLMAAVRSGFGDIHQPTLILKSREDHVIPVRSAEMTFEKISSHDKNLIWLENSYHVATMDYDKDIINRETEAFIRRVSTEHYAWEAGISPDWGTKSE